MKHFIFMTFAACLMVLAATFASAKDGASQGAVDICLIANAGFHIKGKNKSILIDAVLDQGLPTYPVAPKTVRDQIAKLQAPFSDVKAVLATHFHDDHMGPKAIRNLYNQYPSLSFILPPQAYHKIGPSIQVRQNGRLVTLRPKNQLKQLSNIKQLPTLKAMPSVKTMPSLAAMPLIATLPDWSDNESLLDGENLKVKSFRVSHGRGRDIENIGYLITIDGIRIFHPGDIVVDQASLNRAGIRQMDVDVLLLPYWIALDKSEVTVVNQAWKARTIIPMHFDVKTSSWMNPFGGLDGVKKKALAAWPNTIDLSKAGQCYSARPSID